MTRIGIIGCGHWGKNYIRLLSGLPEVELVGIADLSQEALHRQALQYPGIKTYLDYGDMLKDGHLDAVVVATIATTHRKIVEDVLRAGVDVLAEKPLATTTADAQELTDIALEEGKLLMVAHTFLFNPAVRKVKEFLRNDVLGQPYYVKTRRTHLGLVRHDVNAVWDLAPHDISMLLYLFGEEPVEVQAMGGRHLNNEREDAAFINLSFPSGMICHLHVSWADANKERYLDIVGSKARILFDDLNAQEPIRVFHKGVTAEKANHDFGEFKYLVRDDDIVSPTVAMAEPLRVMMQEFLNFRGEGTIGLSDGSFGVQVVKILRQIDAALGLT
jgi:predicted dehydrogenase